uniref:Photosystem II extrinsic protein V n=1 Tax=Platysiphonia delicata TaxID=2006979 RepID=A0A1Z1M0B1_9FLOR|nr:photosystem II cytochrome c550 [Platysiphonia delicata]ARW59497.1 photosystem II cytochrome c550 [Platysiphonia delicata]
MKFKKNILFLFITFLLYVTLIISPVSAVEIDDIIRTTQLDESGKKITFSPDELTRGKRVFNATCAQCHNGGITKTNPNIGLDMESLSLAVPPRDNITNLIDYMKRPTSYDGTTLISELHPSIAGAEIFPKMRNLTDDDLFCIAGYILNQAQLSPEKWGGGKIYY